MQRRTFLALPAAAAAATPQTYIRVSPRDPRYLETTDGQPYIPIGLNMIAPPVKDPDVFTAWLDNLAKNGGNYIRVWLSNTYWDVEHAKSGEYDADKAARIDRMLEQCAARGIRVKMTIEHFRSIGEPPVRQPWADKPIHLASNGGPATSIADFFDGEAPRAQFRRKIGWYSARYKDNPTIYGWELWNEINAVRGGDYLAWTAAMLPELHKAFPRNMAMQSLGSFDTDRVRENYRRHSLLTGNDVAQVHRYLDLGAPLEICHGPVDILAADAVRELISYAPQRPVILAESGAVEPKHTGPFQLYRADKHGIILHDVLFAPFFAGAAGPGQVWHWDQYVAANDLWWHFRRFAEAVKDIDSPAERFQPSHSAFRSLRVYTLRGRKNTLLWLRDSRNTWTSELRDNQEPAPIEIRYDLPRKARAYDPWTGEWSDVLNGRLPPFRRSIVIRYTA